LFVECNTVVLVAEQEFTPIFEVAVEDDNRRFSEVGKL